MGGLVLLAIPSSPEVDHRGSHKWNVRRYTSWRPLVVDALFYRVPWALSLPGIPLHHAVHGYLVGVVVVVLRYFDWWLTLSLTHLLVVSRPD